MLEGDGCNNSFYSDNEIETVRNVRGKELKWTETWAYGKGGTTEDLPGVGL